MDLDVYARDRYKERVALVIKTAAMFLTDEDIDLLADSMQRRGAEEITSAFYTLTGHDHDRPLTLLRATLKDAPFPVYSGYIIAAVFKQLGSGAPLTGEQVAAALQPVLPAQPPGFWAGLSNNATVETVSRFIIEKIGPLLKYMPIFTGAGVPTPAMNPSLSGLPALPP